MNWGLGGPLQGIEGLYEGSRRDWGLGVPFKGSFKLNSAALFEDTTGFKTRASFKGSKKKVFCRVYSKP